jgi:hypothetical protein
MKQFVCNLGMFHGEITFKSYNVHLVEAIKLRGEIDGTYSTNRGDEN